MSCVDVGCPCDVGDALDRPVRPTSSDDPLPELGIEPLGARSVVLSALLGSHPPVLPVRALVALAELFGIRSGTTRTSLSRMVAAGELVGDDGRYSLAGRLLDRQREQDAGRVSPTRSWDGAWITAVAEGDRRPVAERRAFRDAMHAARLAELRPDIWMRPANLAPPDQRGVLVTVGPLTGIRGPALVARLWPLDDLERHAVAIAAALRRQRRAIDAGDVDTLPATFTAAAAAVRFLRSEPQLPDALAPPSWTPPTLRPLYDEFDAAFGRQLRAFFSSVG
ncbi:PaaX domain-containing protein, C- domain protein [Ilumatobacter sp.]|uniref:PaaX domain-containing protein, C- domain protein n=1 Tax=Ilumatobacter sp. TaxID=1967498 RepID=UPI003B524063